MRFGKDTTLSELYKPAMEIQTKKEADEWLEGLIWFGMLHGQTREEATKIQRGNLKYWTKFYDKETMKRVNYLFETKIGEEE